ncbi:hypothetical protein BRM1_00040 [Brevibacterium sp. BRM-1]|uniref:hypothetical protein n=1 Tax=Brevibacterium sp. BRM-1 TaxID=2999062 RepID=UPI00227F74F3|nr:hypothetical protein [Brevibacterium sp. BRM-1]WAL40306.1 hypothetical protein BRM1_00040 [Brevibacterium sp. BRM-1]
MSADSPEPFRPNGMSAERERRLARSAAFAAIVAVHQAHEAEAPAAPRERGLAFASPQRNVRRAHPGTWRRRG